MRRKVSIRVLEIFAALTVIFFSAFIFTDARSLTFVSDLISTSNPSALASHVIEFTPATAIPPRGTIVVYAYNEAFWLQTGYGYTDTEFAIATSGAYVLREIGSVSDSVTDGLAPAGNSEWRITLNSTTGIDAGTRVRLTFNKKNASPRNPATAGAYRIAIRTFDQSGTPLDSAMTIITILEPVSVTVKQNPQPPVRGNGLPSGEIPAGSANVELSLETNEESTCRYSLTPGVSYDSMTRTFLSSGGTIFYVPVSGHQDGTSYSYYVRCKDTSDNVNDDDFEISFSLAATPVSNTSVTETSSGRGGIGIYPNGSSVLYLADTTLSGIGPPSSTLTILLDGRVYVTAQTRDDGRFSKTVSGVERGTYTFNTFATDPFGRNTSSFSATVALDSGTQNKITNIVLSPTVEISPETIGVGDAITISGFAVPNSLVEVYAIRQGEPGVKDLAKFTATSSPAGTWQVDISGSTFKKGVYSVQARTVLDDLRVSSMSRLQVLNVGNGKSGDIGNRSDLNKDGKVNLVDFSILLSFWTTDDSVADINQDGIVNLADFSIMLFNWTG